MRLALLLVVACLMTACSTTIRDPQTGVVIFRTEADATNVTFKSGSTYFHADRLNHSTPTRAGGSVAGTIAAGALPIVTAVGSKLP